MERSEEYIKNERKQDWRVALQKKTKAKDRMSIERALMAETAPEVRITSQRIEVNSGLTKEQALTEASRCMDCVNPTCMEGCPVSINIPKFIKYIETGEILEAASVLKETSALPAVCGRVCPQELQCEQKCFYVEKLNQPAVAIGFLERFAADFERESGHVSTPEMSAANGLKVAVIGSGPSGLTAGYFLSKISSTCSAAYTA